MSALRGVLYDRQAPPPNLSTQSMPVSDANYLTVLDSTTRQVVDQILKEQEKGSFGTISIPGSSQPISLDRPVTHIELNKLRRQFMNYSKTHPIKDTSKISANFVMFITNEFQD